MSIVARDQGRLDLALAEIEVSAYWVLGRSAPASGLTLGGLRQKVRQSPEQIIKAYSFEVDTPKGAEDALEAACAEHGGQRPQTMIFCAGKSRPGFWIEQTEESLVRCMQETYWAQAWSALVSRASVPNDVTTDGVSQAGAKRMVHDRVKGKMVFVGSTLSYMSMVGYSPYAPGKHAVRGEPHNLPAARPVSHMFSSLSLCERPRGVSAVRIYDVRHRRTHPLPRQHPQSRIH